MPRSSKKSTATAKRWISAATVNGQSVIRTMVISTLRWSAVSRIYKLHFWRPAAAWDWNRSRSTSSAVDDDAEPDSTRSCASQIPA